MTTASTEPSTPPAIPGTEGVRALSPADLASGPQVKKEIESAIEVCNTRLSSGERKVKIGSHLPAIAFKSIISAFEHAGWTVKKSKADKGDNSVTLTFREKRDAAKTKAVGKKRGPKAKSPAAGSPASESSTPAAS